MNLRNLAIWGVVVVVLIGLYSMVTGGGQKGANAGEITYSQMLTKVDAGEVKTAEFRQGQVLVTDQAGKTFTAFTLNDQGALATEMRGHGVNISAKPTGNITLVGVLLQ